jgi:hypothetical protein
MAWPDGPQRSDTGTGTALGAPESVPPAAGDAQSVTERVSQTAGEVAQFVGGGSFVEQQGVGVLQETLALVQLDPLHGVRATGPPSVESR